jgi:hypothetical protein
MFQQVLKKQIGWMKCVACSDSTRLRPGQMWLGGNTWIVCPECGGKQQVPRYLFLDPATGREINQEGIHHGS